MIYIGIIIIKKTRDTNGPNKRQKIANGHSEINTTKEILGPLLGQMPRGLLSSEQRALAVFTSRCCIIFVHSGVSCT